MNSTASISENSIQSSQDGESERTRRVRTPRHSQEHINRKVKYETAVKGFVIKWYILLEYIESICKPLRGVQVEVEVDVVSCSLAWNYSTQEQRENWCILTSTIYRSTPSL